MSNEERRTIIDRANRLLRQSKALRKMSNELLQESKDIHQSVKSGLHKTRKNRRTQR